MSARRRAALRLLNRIVEDRLDDPTDQLLIEAWLWRQTGDHGRELAAKRARSELIARRQRSLLCARQRFEAGR